MSRVITTDHIAYFFSSHSSSLPSKKKKILFILTMHTRKMLK